MLHHVINGDRQEVDQLDIASSPWKNSDPLECNETVPVASSLHTQFLEKEFARLAVMENSFLEAKRVHNAEVQRMEHIHELWQRDADLRMKHELEIIRVQYNEKILLCEEEKDALKRVNIGLEDQVKYLKSQVAHLQASLEAANQQVISIVEQKSEKYESRNSVQQKSTSKIVSETVVEYEYEIEIDPDQANDPNLQQIIQNAISAKKAELSQSKK